MNKIPTAEEFLATEFMGMYEPDRLAHIKLLQEFAKLHVKAAIKECIESSLYGSSTDTASYEDVVRSLKDCYPETLIK